ncbi:MAG: RsmD family RNA methyltransferase [bacterium]
MKSRKFIDNKWQVNRFCAEVFQGLEKVFENEIKKITGGRVRIISSTPGLVYFETIFNLSKLYEIKTASSVFVVISVEGNISSPENEKKIIARIKQIIAENNELYGEEIFKTFKITADESASKNFVRLKEIIHEKTQLDLVFKGGDLVMKSAFRKKEFFIRISPRPLSVRFWRNANYNAALNASIAASMVFLTSPDKEDRVLNICAGSGSLLIERCLLSPNPREALGFELLGEVVDIAKHNLKESGIPKKYRIEKGDCEQLSQIISEGQKFNVVLGDLPFGMTVGHKKTNRSLYKKIVLELFKVCDNKTRVALITHDIQSLELVIEEFKDRLKVKEKMQIKMSTQRYGMYIYPMIYIMELLTA